MHPADDRGTSITDRSLGDPATSGLRLRWPAPGLPEGALDHLTGPGAPYELTTEDVLGSLTQVFVRRPRSLLEDLLAGAARFGDRPFVTFPDRTVTFAEMPIAAGHLARTLRDRYGIGKGDRVAVASANRVEYALTFWATTALGAITVAMNGWWTGHEMAYALELTEPTVIMGDRRRLDRLVDQDVPSVPVLCFEEDLGSLERTGAAAAGAPGVGDTPLPPCAIDEDDPAVILFTSGTTGRPKGVMLTHRNVIHFAMASELRGAEMGVRAALAGTEPPPPTLQCAIAVAPMFHVAGLTCSLALAPRNGTTMVYPPPGAWTEEQHLALTEKHRATMWSLVPTQLWRILDFPDLDRYDLSSLRRIGGGSAVWAPELLRRLEEQMPWVRPGLGVGYGMTENNGLGTSLGTEGTYLHPDSIGEAAATVEVEIRDPVDRHALAEGEVGEIALRSAATFLGYWRNPEATRAALDQDRWYHTGDFGCIRDGYVYLEGRRQDLIVRGGENVYPVEIENRIIEHPAVAEVAVVGVAHQTLGQEIAAYVVLREEAALEPQELREWCAATLASFKVPTVVEVVPGLPHNATGKVLKHLIGTDGGGDPTPFVEE